jgi:hypothetical protein
LIVGFVHSDWKVSEELSLEQDRLARAMIQSAREAMPGCELVQFTDMDTKPLVDRVVRKPRYEGMFWMPYVCDFMAETDEEVLLLDTDIIVRKDLRKLFEPKADMVVTFRARPVKAGHRTMHILVGVIASRNKEIWKEASRRISAMDGKDDKNWWGIQLVLWDMLCESQRGESPFAIAAVDQKQFNYVPKYEEDIPENAWAIHFKGIDRKLWMLNRFGVEKTTV